MSKRKILAACIAASLASHIISLVFLQIHSFLAPSPHTALTNAACLPSKGEILKQSFQGEPLEKSRGVSCPPQPHPETPAISLLSLAVQPIETPPLPIAVTIPTAPLNYELAIPIQKPIFTLPPLASLNLFEHLPKDLILPAPSLAKAFQTTPSFHPKSKTAFVTTPALQQTSPSQITYSAPLIAPTLDESLPPPQVLPKVPDCLPDFPTLADLETSSYSDFFDVEIVFSPLENEEGYVFALTLIPQPGLAPPKIRQHYSFLIDRSNSIQKDRLTAVKRAVLKALEELDLDDSFNIIVFDSKIVNLSPSPLLATSSSLQAARNFLDQVHLGSFFSTANLCKPLQLTIPPSTQNDGQHSAILFSDGESLRKLAAQRELALEWTAFNNGRVSLFAIGVGGDPELATLDAAAAFNRGKVLYSPTKKGIQRKLLKLMKTIRHPIAKNLTATAVPRSSQTKISLYPKTQQMPSLYRNEPYVIIGTIDKLDNFVLFVQGKLKNQWLNIKKNISFVNAKKGDASLKAEWALQQAYQLYETYLYDLNPAHLAEASELLAPHGLQVAFQ